MVINAKYKGFCRGCNSPISIGSLIEFVCKGSVFHIGCFRSIGKDSKYEWKGGVNGDVERKTK